MIHYATEFNYHKNEAILFGKKLRNDRNEHGQTPFMVACARPNTTLECAKQLITKQNVNIGYILRLLTMTSRQENMIQHDKMFEKMRKGIKPLFFLCFFL